MRKVVKSLNYSDMNQEQKKVFDKYYNNLRKYAKEQLQEKCYTRNINFDWHDDKISLMNKLTYSYCREDGIR